jgi:hypothetical protein
MAEYYSITYSGGYYNFLNEEESKLPESKEKRDKMTSRDWAKEQIYVLCQDGSSKEDIIGCCSSEKSKDIEDHILITEEFDSIIKEMIDDGLIRKLPLRF